MKTQKAGCILINKETRCIGLVYRDKLDDYSFPKGHLENGETLQECAIRETEEETGRKNHLAFNEAVYKLEYVTPRGEDVENYMFIAIDDGTTEKNIPDDLKEKIVWVKIEEVEDKLSYQDLKEMWNELKTDVLKLL
jgi:8-oxo-dGTP diphosphatase